MLTKRGLSKALYSEVPYHTAMCGDDANNDIGRCFLLIVQFEILPLRAVADETPVGAILKPSWDHLGPLRDCLII